MNFSQRKSRAQQSFIACRVGEVTYAVNIEQIKEIIQPGSLEQLPQSPDYIIGTLHYRNAIIPIIDLRVRLGLGASDSLKIKWIILELDHVLYGLAVDHVIEVFHAPIAEFYQAPNRRNAEARLAQDIVNYAQGTAYILALSQLTDQLDNEFGTGRNE